MRSSHCQAKRVVTWALCPAHAARNPHSEPPGLCGNHPMSVLTCLIPTQPATRRDLAQVVPLAPQTPPQVDGVFCDKRIICWSTLSTVAKLPVATTEKWQGRPHLAFANGVGGFRWYWNLLSASPRTFLDAAVSDDRVHLRTTTVPGSSVTAPSNSSRSRDFFKRRS